MTKPSTETSDRLAQVQAYRFGRCELRPGERVLQVDGEPANIGGRAFDVLLALVELRGRVVGKDELLERVWPGLQVEENNLSTQVSLLRRLVGRDTIATVSGLGYRFTAVVQRLDRPPEPPDAAALGSQATPVPPAADEVLRFGGLEWRPGARAVILDGRRAEIGSRAMDLLGVLVAERHRVVTKHELLERVWPGMVVEENNLQVHVSTLRKLLGQDAVATVPGRGYRFTMQPSVPEAPAPHAEATPTPARTNLPHAQEALIGRVEELERLERLLGSHRMLSIVGAGGMGKTRVAQALARAASPRFTHGVWWADLGALTAPGDVPLAVASAARVQIGSGEPLQQLALALQSRNTLIVLDNCEHLVEEASRLAKAVLDGAAQVTLVATSQKPLRVNGEQVFRLGGLMLPQAGASLAEARTSGALMLLEKRARAVSIRFALTQAMLPAVIALCRQLDGIPLAIEMAAAQLPLLGSTALHSALDERLRWLRSGSRKAIPRHQTLRATLDWSHSLLNRDEQTVLRRLAVFARGFTLESAKCVASDAALDTAAVVEALSTLVDRSLVQIDDGEPPRYRLLESVRLYGGEQLHVHGETEDVKTSHARLMATIGDEAEQSYWTVADAAWLARYDPEYDDLHSAFVHTSRSGDAARAAATLDALYRLDELHGIAVSMAARLPAAQALLPNSDPATELRLRLLIASPFVAQLALPGMSKFETVQPAVKLARNLDDTPRLYRALMSLALQATVAGKEAVAVRALDEAQALEQPSWPARLLWLGAVHRSFRHALRGESSETLLSLRRELAFAEQAGSAVQSTAARANLADCALMCGNVAEAVRLGIAAADEAKARGYDNILGSTLANLCGALVAAGDLTKASEIAREAIESVWRHDRFCYLMDHLSLLSALEGRYEDSLLFIGFADAWWASVQYARESNEAMAVARAMTLNEQALGASEAARLRAAGAQLKVDSAKEMALACIGARTKIQRLA